jgi:hypothetical protein
VAKEAIADEALALMRYLIRRVVNQVDVRIIPFEVKCVAAVGRVGVADRKPAIRLPRLGS